MNVPIIHRHLIEASLLRTKVFLSCLVRRINRSSLKSTNYVHGALKFLYEIYRNKR